MAAIRDRDPVLRRASDPPPVRSSNRLSQAVATDVKVLLAFASYPLRIRLVRASIAV